MFIDRLEAQQEISVLIQSVFGDKKRINYEDYVKINQEMTSEMFLSILTLLQTNLPCSVNYYRYKNNYEKYVGDDAKEGDGGDGGQVIKTIASPRIMSKLSPVANLVSTQGINVAPVSQKGLLKYAMNKDKPAEGGKGGDSDSDDETDYSKFGSKKEAQAAKEKRKAELEELKKQGKDMIDETNAIRLPNRNTGGVTIDPNTGTAKQGNARDMIMSPTSFLRGAGSP